MSRVGYLLLMVAASTQVAQAKSYTQRLHQPAPSSDQGLTPGVVPTPATPVVVPTVSVPGVNPVVVPTVVLAQPTVMITATPEVVPTVSVPIMSPVLVPTVALPQPTVVLTATPTPTQKPRPKVLRRHPKVAKHPALKHSAVKHGAVKHVQVPQVRQPKQQWVLAYLSSYCPGSAGGLSSSGIPVFYGMLANNYYPFGTHVYLPVLGITGVVEDHVGAFPSWYHFDVWSPVCYSTPTGYFRVAVQS